MKYKQAIEKALGRRLLLGEMMARNSRKFPDKEALIFGETRLTYKEPVDYPYSQFHGSCPEAL